MNPARKVLGQAADTFVKMTAPVLILAYQRHLGGATFSLSAYAQTIIAAGLAAGAILWHGLPALVGARRAAQLDRLVAFEAKIKADIYAQQSEANVPPASMGPTP